MNKFDCTKLTEQMKANQTDLFLKCINSATAAAAVADVASLKQVFAIKMRIICNNF